jgi:hypothetical protein
MSKVMVHQAGPLPIDVQTTWPGNESLLIAVSGSAYAKSPNTMLTVKVQFDSTTLATLQIWANAASTHMAFPTTFFTVPGTIGPVHIGLVAGDGTLTDVNDMFTVAVIY